MSRRNVLRSVTSALTAVALCGAALVGAITSASAAPAPVVPMPATGVSADALPTVQINGVVWSQVVIGDIVYAGGSFSTARPAGAAPGTNTVPRTNLLAYDIRTGVLVPGFAPQLNGQVLSVAASPDGTRLYAAGDFTTVNGIVRYRVAALDPTTGAVITAFNTPGVTSQARAVIATATTVYVGGGFQATGNGASRRNLAAFNASNGAVLPWNPDADYNVWAIAVSGDGRWVFAGGSFQYVNGLPAVGLAKIDSVTGVLQTAWDPAVNNYGPSTGISSLRVQGNYVYGTSWAYANPANLEGAFKIPVGTDGSPATLEWITECHGDNYSVFMTGGFVYTAGHAHFCGSMGGGFPQPPSWRYQYAQAWTDAAGGEILNDVLKAQFNWHGKANGPSLVAWNPDMTLGTYTGQYQAGWNVAGNNDYVVYGGEFPTVNGVGQQGLVRFARRGLAPNKEGPRFPGGTFVPRLVPTSSSTVRVSWVAGYDRDDYTLTYRVIRNGATGSPRFTTTANSMWWTLPAVGFVDTGLTPGATYSYQLIANDQYGNTVYGAVTNVTMPGSSSPSNGYAQSVRANGARIYWPMNETSGLTVNDRAAGTAATSGIGVTDGRGDTGVTWNQPGAIAGDTSAALTDNDWSRVYALGSETAPDTFTIQAWVRTSNARGGRIFGFGDLQNGASGHRDRQLYMDTSGRIVFGMRAQDFSYRTVTSGSSYRDNGWHMVTATMSSAGMRLYVDGGLVGSRTDTTAGEAYLGYWRLGGDSLVGWPGAPSNPNLIGWVDEIAVYPTALAQATIQAQYALRNGGGGGGNQPPSASFTWGATGLTASFDGTGSSDPDGSVSSYAWSFGDGTTGSGSTPSHTYAAPGTYSVQLTVTDNQGAVGSTTRQVTVSAPGVIATDTFERTVVDGWGQADTGGTWTLTTAASNFAVAGGMGTMKLAASSGPSAYLASTSARDVDLRTTLGFDKAATGGGVYTAAVVRRIGTSDYRLKVRVTGTDTTAYLARTVGGVETVLTTASLPGVVVAGGGALSMRIQAVGAGTTTLNAKVWPAGTAEPGAWTTTTTDSTAGLQAAGAVGLYAYLSGSATNAPITVSVPDLSAVAP